MKYIGTKTLETERLILRKTEEDDYLPMFRNWAGDERVTRFMTWTPYKSAEDLKNSYHKYLMENRDRGDMFDWKIVLKETGEPIGSIGVTSLNENIGSCDIGYCLGYNWWHKGIMSEAFSEIIRFIFEEADFNRIVAFHDVDNPRSGMVMKKCGLSFEGILKQSVKNNKGELKDATYYAILKSEYKGK